MTDREAIKMAFDTLVNLTSVDEYGSKEEIIAKHKTMGMLRQALAQPEQAEYDKLTVKFGERAKEYLEEAKKSWQPEQEPVAWEKSYDLVCALLRQAHDVLATASYPMRRPWVGLTDDDIPESYAGDKSFLNIAKWADAKLKEKNK